MPSCRCGHELMEHAWHGRCLAFLNPMGRGDFAQCQCPRFDDSALPGLGERPVFGVHHLASLDADWTTPSDAAREAKFRAWVKGAPMDQS